MSFRASEASRGIYLLNRFLRFVPTPAKGMLGQASRHSGRNDNVRTAVCLIIPIGGEV
jgi:hypothetical protein